MDVKKLFKDKDATSHPLQDFINKKGFYIVLGLCMVILVSTVMLVTAYNVSPPSLGESKIAKEHIGSGVGEGSAGLAIVGPVASSTTNDQTAAPASVNTSKPLVTGSAPSKEAAPLQKFSMPVRGEITFNFSSDKLIYSKTLDEWRTHAGIDIASPLGASVKAVADGVVCEIKNDPRLGVTVVVKQSDTIKTVYANLANENMVSIGKEVKQSDIIGTVGNTASIESAEQPHLHFEVLKNDIPDNPSNYLPFKG